jgi:hypothetical protein
VNNNHNLHFNASAQLSRSKIYNDINDFIRSIINSFDVIAGSVVKLDLRKILNSLTCGKYLTDRLMAMFSYFRILVAPLGVLSGKIRV